MSNTTGRAARLLATAGLVLAVAAAAAVLGAGPGTRFGLWHFRTAFQVMRLGAYAGVAALLLGVIALLARGPRGRALGAAALGLCVFLGPLLWSRSAGQVPPIHDIATDTDDPPVFVDVVARRSAATNPVAYGGPEIAAQQHRAFPDLAPLHLDVPPAEALHRAVQAARGLHWEIVSEAPAQGRLEATDTTFWFGFKDDVVVRVRPEGAGSRVDVRSLSRVGRGDLGMNAKRIRRFLERLRSA